MHQSVQGCKEDDHGTAQFVKVDVLVEGQNTRQSEHSQPSDAVTQHKNHHKSAIEIEQLTWIRQ